MCNDRLCFILADDSSYLDSMILSVYVTLMCNLSFTTRQPQEPSSHLLYTREESRGFGIDYGFRIWEGYIHAHRSSADLGCRPSGAEHSRPAKTSSRLPRAQLECRPCLITE